MDFCSFVVFEFNEFLQMLSVYVLLQYVDVATFVS